ncbi:MAG: hypothetical protein ACM3VS_13855 [Candidatus Dadabacteria bacterium]
MTTIESTPDYFLIDQWESWIEEDHENDHKATLYVFGEIYWNEKRIRPALVRKLAQPHDVSQLDLEIRPSYLWDSGVITEIRYSESVRLDRKYTKVNIYIGDTFLVSLDPME